MPKITGRLTDFGLDPMQQNAPRVVFTYTNPAGRPQTGIAKSAVLASHPVISDPEYNGFFEAELIESAAISPAGYYTVSLEWRDDATRVYRRENLPGELYVPAAGGVLADLLRIPANPALVWTGAEPPANPSPGSWWQTPDGDIYEWAGTGWNFKNSIRGPAGYNATGAVQNIQTLADYAKQTAGANAFGDALNEVIEGARMFRSRAGVPFIRIDPTPGDPTATNLEISPPADGARTKIDFWSAPFGTPGRMRTMSIESHGTADPYNPDNHHNSIYTTDAAGEYHHVFDWDWGPTYDSLINVPEMAMVFHRETYARGNLSIGIRNTESSVAGARTLRIQSPDNGKPAEVRLFSYDGLAEARFMAYHTRAFAGTYTNHEMVLIAGGQDNANLTLKTNGDAVFARTVGIGRDLGVGTTNPAPTSAGRRVLHLVDAAAIEIRNQVGTVQSRLYTHTAGAQLGTDSAHDFLLYAGGSANAQIRLGAGGTLGFFNRTPAAKPTGVAKTPEAIHAALTSLGLIS